jgi:hypothetical protein
MAYNINICVHASEIKQLECNALFMFLHANLFVVHSENEDETCLQVKSKKSQVSLCRSPFLLL